MFAATERGLSTAKIEYIGKTVYAEIKEPDGYMQGGDDTTTFGIVKPNNATILKVYYDKYSPLPEPTEVGQTPSPSPSPTPTATPVSYTHLDVYKRQGYDRCRWRHCHCG